MSDPWPTAPLPSCSLSLVVDPEATPVQPGHQLGPANLFGDLFHRVQMQRVFADGKDFADAIPRAIPADILAAYCAATPISDVELKSFALRWFDVPTASPTLVDRETSEPIDARIRRLWSELTRPAFVARPSSSALSMIAPYVVPGGRFRELYYWDSFYTMVGLRIDRRHDLLEGMIDNFAHLIERHGHIPNGSRTYYLSRSQPPHFALMVALSRTREPATLRRRLDAMRTEHAWWMRGAEGVEPGCVAARVIRLPDGSVLNRYWDECAAPRDESYREDALVAGAADRPAPEVYRDLRAGAESGWDYSSRWFAADRALSSIMTTSLVPIDLNSLLFATERIIGNTAAVLGRAREAATYRRTAGLRRAAIARWLWNEQEQRFTDYDWRSGTARSSIDASITFPLFVGVATAKQAARTAELIASRLLAPGGLRTTCVETGEQWDAPNGWAPLQFAAERGLRRYGHAALATEIASRWLRTVETEFQRSGLLVEKYDVEKASPGGGGEYLLQDGFGWTNGVTQFFRAILPAKR